MPTTYRRQGANPLVSIVIPSVDGGEMLLRCVESIANQTYSDIEVILVDNGSSDGSAERAGDILPKLRVIRNESNQGFAPACNQGAREARGDYLLFLNSDAVAEPNSVEELVRIASDNSIPVLQPLLVTGDGSVDSAGDLFTWSGFFWHLQEKPGKNHLQSIFATKGACMLVKRSVFAELDGFIDSYFAYFEEADLCWRARLRGYEVALAPSVVVLHIGGQTTSRILEPHQIYHLSFRNRLRSLICNPSRLSMIRILIGHLPACAATALVFLARGRIRVAFAILQALVWPVLNTGSIRTQRRKVQGSRKVGDAEVFRTDLRVPLSPERAGRLLTKTLGRWATTKDHG